MIDPVVLTLGPLQIRWYGLIMVLAFLFGARLAIKIGKRRNITKTQILDFLVYLIIFSIIFARLFHIFIYNFSYYMDHQLQMLQIWKGGLSIHGGVIGAVLAGLWFCKKNNIKFYDLADTLIVPFSFGIIFGRIGNLINQELYGKITTLPWGMYFDNVIGKRHPAQIYESIMHALIFVTLFFMYTKKKLTSGTIFWSFVTLYSFFRFLAEFLRANETILAFNLTIAQWISMGLFVLGIIMLIKLKKSRSFINNNKPNEIGGIQNENKSV